MKKILIPKIDFEQVSDEIGDFIVDEITSIGYTGGVLGMSGGVDSTVAAILAKRAFNKYNAKNPKQRLELKAYILPSKLNAKEDETDAVKVARKEGIDYEIINIEPLVEAVRFTNPEAYNSKYNKGNLISELRAVVLHGKAATEKKLVIGTGNRDEDFGVGYYTLFGDGAVHISPNGQLSKRLVREMATYQGYPEFAKRTSAPGLEPGQTAFKDLGYRYDPTIELVREGIEQGFSLEELFSNEDVIEACHRDIERYEKVYGAKKFTRVEDMVYNIFSKNRIAKAKSRIVHPPIAKITLNYDFGGK